ncbi:hypothetical protein N9E91_02465 [Alphaproteobacteria bacterium]|nr:hypothetical protein [Alphaproteobacteria bacterium]
MKHRCTAWPARRLNLYSADPGLYSQSDHLPDRKRLLAPTITAKHLALERAGSEGQYGDMVRGIFRILGYLFGLLAIYAIWLDLTATSEASLALGTFWANHHINSLLFTQNLVSRYVDPCALIVGLGCEPFLWLPVISTFLGWPAALDLLFMAAVFGGFGRVMRRRYDHRISARSLKRRGEK